MKISYSWLKEYLDIDLDHIKVAEILTNIGLEVEGIEEFCPVKGGLEGCVIGKVISVEKHPNADKLTLTKVSLGGDDTLSIICGAPNVLADQNVVVATVGTTLYKGDENFKIKRTKIRGIESEGMICAEDEIGLGTSHEGIMVLKSEARIGTPAKEYFDIKTDHVFEIGLTPNRIDSASHFGVARDFAAYLSQQSDVQLRKPVVNDFSVDNHNMSIPVIVENSTACPRYSGVCIAGVEIKESPDWLKYRLESIGLKPINNVVDITNFVLHEFGQPLHAFDAAKITGDKVIVKTLPHGAMFTTLDEIKRELSDEDLMICNESDGMCIAGVFGGIESGVTEKTKNIFLESAYFNPVFIRRTSKRHQLFTDSSFRFERGTDPNNTVFALKRAAKLISELAGGSISSEIIDVYPEPVKDFRVSVRFDHVSRLIGKEIPRDKIREILKSLQINIIDETDELLILDVPTFKVDVTREADVIEEILRIYGYNNVEITNKVNSTLSYTPKPDQEKVINSISDYLSNNGFLEVMANSLTKDTYYEQLESYNKENLVSLHNPLSADLRVLRQTLLFGGLEAISYNSNRKNFDLKLFELGNCYYLKNKHKKSDDFTDRYGENQSFGLFITGKKNQKSWNLNEASVDFYHLKAFVSNILKKSGFPADTLSINEISNDIFQYGLEYIFHLNNMPVNLVKLGKIQNSISGIFDLENEIFYAEINWNKVTELIKSFSITFRQIPKFQEVKRDLALLLDKNIKFEDIRKVAIQTDKKILKNISLFDVFESEKIGKNKKSYAVSLTLQDEEKTLNDKQIDKIMKRFIMAFENKLGAQIR